jgi:hypothetical protein
MSLHDKNEKDKINDNTDSTDYTVLEQLINWCYANKKTATIAISVMLVHSLIFVGIIVLRTGNSSDRHVSAHPSHPSHQQTPQFPEPAEDPAYITDSTAGNIEDNSDSSESGSMLSAAYDAGVQTGEIFIDTRDVVVDFFQGLNEATGATVWARELWDSSRERVTGWLENNTAADDIVDDDIDSDEYITDGT